MFRRSHSSVSTCSPLRCHKAAAAFFVLVPAATALSCCNSGGQPSTPEAGAALQHLRLDTEPSSPGLQGRVDGASLIAWHAAHARSSGGIGRSDFRASSSFRATLLLAFFWPEPVANEHWYEMRAALAVNLANPFIDELHVLMEQGREKLTTAGGGAPPSERAPAAGGGAHLAGGGPPPAGWGAPPAAAWGGPPGPGGRAPCRRLASWLEQAGLPVGKLRCVHVAEQPSCAALLRYANTTLPDRNVLLSNADIAFDSSLGLIRPDYHHGGRRAFVLSVRTPPQGGLYRSFFGQDCSAAPTCVTGPLDGFGWEDGTYGMYAGSSWDAYVLRTPLPSRMNLSAIGHPMNRLQAENRVAYQLEVEGSVALLNPCWHVGAFHWHCLGHRGYLSEGANASVADRFMVSSLYPCWDCPGVTPPAGAVQGSKLCESGVRRPVEVASGFARLFGSPKFAEVCCRNSTVCDQERMVAEWVKNHTAWPICRAAEDVGCVISDGARTPHRIWTES